MQVRPDVRQLDRRVAPAPQVFAAEPVDPGVEVEVLLHREVRVEGELLAHVADPLADLPSVADDVVPEHGRGPGGGRQETAEDANERRLAGAVRPQQPVDRAGVDLEVHPLERGEVAELARHVRHPDRDVAH